MALSFVVPDLELNNKITRILLLLKNLSYNKAGTPVLTTEKIAVYDFFLQHAFILHSILKANSKKLFSLRPDELESINREYPNTSGLYQHKDLRITLQILLLYDFATVALSPENEAVYYITQKGNDFIVNIESDYASRLDELSKSAGSLQSSNYRQLIAYIKPYTNGK